MRQTILFLAMACVILGDSAFTAANELDQEKSVTNVSQRVLAEKLPGTVVVRRSEKDQSVSVLHSEQVLPATQASQLLLNDAAFSPMSVKDVMNGSAQELDHETSSDSWVFYFNSYNWYAPAYYYSGYTFYYQPYYTYSYAPYTYYYYWYPIW